MKFKLHEEVTITKEVSYVDDGEEGILPAGTKGVIVSVYDGKPLVMVEFFDEHLETICVEVISEAFLSKKEIK